MSSVLLSGRAYNPPKCTLHPGVNAMLRKVAAAAASKPQVEIRQSGEQFYIKTSTSVRTTEINFHIGQEFDEETVDGRKCKVSVFSVTIFFSNLNVFHTH